jgi:hypothetical protein
MATPVEFKDEIKEWFMQDPMRSLRNCADQFDVPYETVRDWGKKEKWYRERLRRSDLGELPEDVGEQAEAIRLVLVRRIIQGIDSDSLSELIGSWLSIVAIRGQEEPGVDRDSLLEGME